LTEIKIKKGYFPELIRDSNGDVVGSIEYSY